MTETPHNPRLSPWKDPASASDVARLSGHAGLLQFKTAGPLLAYPTGRSAMLWYGASDDLAPLVQVGLEACHGYRDLRWRFLVTPDEGAAQRLLHEHLTRFTQRFGRPPIAMPQV